MFDLSWGEMGIIAVVALVVLGPKELPNALRTGSQWLRAARKLANEFQSGVNEIIREADLEDARKQINEGLSAQSIQKHIENAVDPTGEIKASLAVDELNVDPNAPVAAALTNGAGEMPGPQIPGPETPGPETPTTEIPESEAAADFDSAPTLPASAAVDTPNSDASVPAVHEQPAAEIAGAEKS